MLLRLATAHEIQAVIIDTTSRVVKGKENDSDTIVAYSQHTGFPLKAAGITVVRLDHLGKDKKKGARCSSAKGDAEVKVVQVQISDVNMEDLIQAPFTHALSPRSA